MPLCSVLTAAGFACQRSRLLSRVQLFAPPWTVVCQPSLSMWFSRQEYWNELPFSPPCIEPMSPASAGRFLTTEPPGEFAYFTNMSLQGSSFHSFLQLKEESCFSFAFFLLSHWASLVAQLVKNPPAMLETCVWSLGRSSGEGNGNPLQYSGLENSWTVRGIAKSRTRLSEFQFQFSFLIIPVKYVNPLLNGQAIVFSLYNYVNWWFKVTF